MKGFTQHLFGALNAAAVLALPISSESDTPAELIERNSPRQNTWQPKSGDTWQIVLDSPIDPSHLGSSKASIFDIDLFDNSAANIATLRSAPLNKKVICYFSAGSYEPGRPDSGSFTAADKGNGLDGWPGEMWLNVKSANVRNIMVKRLQLAAQKGCDAVDPDNIDGYQNDNGLGLTMQDSIDFVNFLASQAASLNLAIGLKNAGDIITSVLPNVQFAVNEQCAQYSECDTWSPFFGAGKPVFHIEYPSSVPNVSAAKMARWCGPKTGGSMVGFSTVLKKMSLDGTVQLCDGSKYKTGTLKT